MTQVKIEEIEVGDVVYYIPSHLEKTMENADKGIVTKIEDNSVWVRYRGPTGALTPTNLLYK